MQVRRRWLSRAATFAGLALVVWFIGSGTAAQAKVTAAAAGTTYYVNNSVTTFCSNSNAGTSPAAPWCTVARAMQQEPLLQPGDSVLFKCGDVWNEQLDISNVNGSPSAPITFGHYGDNCRLAGGAATQSYDSELPTLNGGSTRLYGVDAIDTTISYVTIDGFRVHDATSGGIIVTSETCGDRMPGIVIENNVVSEVGAGAYAGGGAPFDDNHYNFNAGIGFTHDCAGSMDGVHILNNTVWDTGGHNTMRVHYDASPDLLVKGNMVGPGCLHNCIDTKGVRGYIEDNVTTCSETTARGQQCGPGNAGLYSESPGYAAGATPHWIGNIEYNIGVCIQVEGNPGGPESPTIYNNTCHGAYFFAFYIDKSSTCDVQKNIVGGPGPVVYRCASSTWDYNDDYGSSGNPTGVHDISVDPQYVDPAGFPPADYQPQNRVVLSYGVHDTVTPTKYIGALGR